MEIVITRTGDPWMDWGLVALAQVAEDNPELDGELESGMLRLSVTNVEVASNLLRNYLVEQLNRCVLRPLEVKLLGYGAKRLETGFLDPGQEWKLSDKERQYAVERLRHFEAKRQRKNVDAEDLRVPKIKPGAKVTASLKRNYPGIKKDWEKLGKAVDEDVRAFFDQWRSGGDKPCSLCGREAAVEYEMRQNKNPFYNQHHNNVVRGHRGSVVVASMCPTCNLLNTFAAACADLPYFVEGRTHLLVPQVDDLTLLAEVRHLIRNNSLDMASPLLLSYRTNIRELPGGDADLYTSLIGVYWNLRHRYTYHEETGLEDWDFGLEPAKQTKVGRWVVYRYSKGTNVIFAHFNFLQVNSRLFKLVESLQYGDGKEGDLYRHLLRFMSAGNRRSRELFSEGLVSRNWRHVSTALFDLYKEGRPLATGFARPFFDYALEVDNVLEKQLLEDVRTVSGIIGRVFASDVGLMTSINNAHDETTLRRVLKDAFLKMHKIAATTKKFGGEDVWAPKESRVENILSSVNKENVAEIRDTMLIYASLAAMHNLRNEKKEQGGEAK
ncbi:MAG: hypothetical protein FH749_15060 [Firmicutes bacterium]|nr:hypothetical protein [Bacillota bacterium]